MTLSCKCKHQLSHSLSATGQISDAFAKANTKTLIPPLTEFRHFPPVDLSSVIEYCSSWMSL